MTHRSSPSASTAASARSGRGATRTPSRRSTAALALDPRSVKANFKLGLTLERQRKWARAEAAFRAARPRQARSRDRVAPPRGGVPPPRQGARGGDRRARGGAAGPAQRGGAPRARGDPRAPGPARTRRWPTSRRRSAWPRRTRSRAHGLGLALAAQGRDGEAAAAFAEAVRLDPARPPGARSSTRRPSAACGGGATRRRPIARPPPCGRTSPCCTAASGSCSSACGATARRWPPTRAPRGSTPTSARWRARLGRVLERQGRFADAEAALLEALRREPDLLDATWASPDLSPPGQVGRGGARLRARDPPQAGRRAPARRSRPGPRGAGAARRRRGRVPPRASRWRPTTPTCTSSSASRWAARGATRRRRPRCARRCASIPRTWWPAPTSPSASGRQGRHAESEAAYRQALELKPDGAPLHRGLGMALYSQGKRAEAEAAFREAVRAQAELRAGVGRPGRAADRDRAPRRGGGGLPRGHRG